MPATLKPHVVVACVFGLLCVHVPKENVLRSGDGAANPSWSPG
jgi:hypothetical protein